MNDFHIRAVHINGCTNHLSDCLSQWNLNEKYQKKFHRLTEGINTVEIEVKDTEFAELYLFSFSGDTSLLQNLKLKMLKSQMCAFNKGTFNSYLRHCRVYMEFYQLFGWECFPLEQEKSALFMTYLDNGNRNADTIRSYHSSVRSVARILGIKVPKKEFSDVLLVLREMQKANPQPKRLAYPMTPSILRKIRYTINHDDPFQATRWSLFLTSFFLLLRKSNVCKTYGTEGNYLRRSHISRRNNHILVQIFWTKTLQLWEKVLEMPLLSIPGCSLCPVKAMKRMLKLVPSKHNMPLFANEEGSQITYPVYMKFLKEKIHEIGLNKTNFSTHSFHRGAVSWAIKCGIPESLIQVMGDSDSYKMCINCLLDVRC